MFEFAQYRHHSPEKQEWSQPPNRRMNPSDVRHNTCPPDKPFSQLRALVLLGGLVRPTQLSTVIDRSVLDLPINNTQSLLEHWLAQACELVDVLQIGSLPVRVVIDQQSVSPHVPASDPRVAVTIERDIASFRGTGGVLHDLSSDYQPNDYLLVANAAQVLLEPLPQLTNDLAGDHADVSVIASTQGVPSGLMLVRCDILNSIAPIGFVDMKEQVLPKIASSHCVRVKKRSSPAGLPIRTLSTYINALRAGARGNADATDAFAEDWQSTFSIVEEGAEVDPAARTHDSVVLKGARVDRGALLVRSVVCAGAIVKRDETVVDQLLSPNKQERS